jgi:hypothetical protein
MTGQVTDSGRELLAVTGAVTSKASLPENEVEVAVTSSMRVTDPPAGICAVPVPVADPLQE